MRRFFSLFVLFVVLSSCENHIAIEAITKANELLQEKPDSALMILRQLDTNTIHSAKWKARYALTKATALDKNFIDTTDASFLCSAEHFFSRYGTPEEKMKFHYYVGRIQFNASDYSDAIVSFMKALELSESSKDTRMKGLICSAIGDTYNRTYCNEDNLKYKKKAHDYYQICGDSLDIDYSRINMGIAFHNVREDNSSDSILQCVKSQKLINRVRVLLSENEIRKENPDANRVLSLFNEVMSRGKGLTVGQYYEYCYALSLVGRITEANAILKKLKSYPESAESLWWLYRIYKLENDTKDALAIYEKYSEMRDSIVKAQLSQSAYKALSQHYITSSTISEARANQSRISAIATIVISILLVLISFLIFQLNRVKLIQKNDYLLSQRDEAARMIERLQSQNENERRDSEQQIQELSNEKKLLSDANSFLAGQNERLKQSYESELLHLRSDFANLYRSQFEEINNLFNKGYSVEKLSESTKKAYAQKYGSIISEIYNYPSRQRDFEDRINRSLYGIMKKLRSDFPEFNEDRFQLASYIIVGFDACTLSFILNTTKNNIWVKKHRLIQKIMSKDTPNIKLYKVFFN